ncbi:MAG: hypothetical protein M3Z82_10080 [Apilactobacillus sp.]|nr:hypothetical protein [Apilactobacillus sp.]
MKKITKIAFESYKEDLRSYDRPDCFIENSKYDWKMSYVAYDAMLNALTNYRDLKQPDTDYETFGLKCNKDVIYLAKDFFKFYDLFLINKKEYNNIKGKKGFIKGKTNLFYLLKKISK